MDHFYHLTTLFTRTLTAANRYCLLPWLIGKLTAILPMPNAAACVPNSFVLAGTIIPLLLLFIMLIALYWVYNRMVKDKRYLFDFVMDKA